MKPIEASLRRATALISFLILSAGLANAQTLPTATSIAQEMGIAWNIGNSLEVPGDPLLWGNPLPTQRLIDSVKAAGFKTVRIPAAWDSHADQITYEIDPNWMAQVKQVVDFCIKDSLFVILNSHWDGGWLEENISTSKQVEVNKKQGAYWRQIATTFRDYGRHLLFASANEPAVQDTYGTPFGPDRMAVLNSYHQTFIDSVRATGSNNASRTLIVQGPRGDIELTNTVMTIMPTDRIADRIMAEVHFYPYQFTLMERDESWGKVFYYWGNGNHSTTDTDRNSTWGEEPYVDSMFNLMKTQFVDRNIPVILGEFGAVKRMTLTGDSLNRHILSRRYFYQYVISSAKSRGIIPVAWDAGGKGNLTMTIFDRRTGAIYDLGLLNAIRHGAGMPKLPGDTSLVQIATGNNVMKILYSAKDSLWGQVDLGVLKENITTYDSIIVRAFVNGETNYYSSNTLQYGYVSLSLVTMSDNWKWREAPFGTVTMDNWDNYSIPISTDTTDEGALVPADPSKIDFFALQVYSKGYRGTIYVDWIVFKSKTGVSDTVYSFNQTAPEDGKGNVESVNIFSSGDVETDQEWKTSTSSIWSTISVQALNPSSRQAIRATMSNGHIYASWFAQSSGTVQVTLRNLQGQTFMSRSLRANAGMNTFKLPTNYRGTMIVHIKQHDNTYIGKLISH